MEDNDQLLKQGINKSPAQQISDKDKSENFTKLVKKSAKYQVAFVVSFVILASIIGGAIFAYIKLSSSKDSKVDQIQDQNEQEQGDTDEDEGDTEPEIMNKVFSVTIENSIDSPFKNSTFEFEYSPVYYALLHPTMISMGFPVYIEVSETENVPSPDVIESGQSIASITIVDKASPNNIEDTMNTFNVSAEEAYVINFTANQCFVLEAPFEHVQIGGREVVRKEFEGECYLPTAGDEQESPVPAAMIVYGFYLSDEYFVVVYNQVYGGSINDIDDDELKLIVETIEVNQE